MKDLARRSSLLVVILQVVTVCVLLLQTGVQLRAVIRQEAMHHARQIADFDERYDELKRERERLNRSDSTTAVEAGDWFNDFFKLQMRQFQAVIRGDIPESTFTYWISFRHRDANDKDYAIRVGDIDMRAAWASFKLRLQNRSGGMTSVDDCFIAMFENAMANRLNAAAESIERARRSL